MAHGPAILTPTSAAEAVELFGNGDDTMVIGGGTIAIAEIQLNLARPKKALLLQHAGLNSIVREGTRVTIGAMTPLSALADLPEPISACIRHIADLEVRGQATIGGNLCASNRDAPRGDLQGVLIALAATVRSVGAGGERSEPAEDFLANRSGRLVLDIAYDESASGVYRYLDRMHTHEYTALAVTAVRTADGSIRLGATGVGDYGRRLASAEAVADDPTAAGHAALADTELLDDAIASVWYRQQTLPVLVRRALEQLKETA